MVPHVRGRGAVVHEPLHPMLSPLHTRRSRLEAPALLLAAILAVATAGRLAAQDQSAVIAPDFELPGKGSQAARFALQPCAGYDAGSARPGAATATSNDLTFDTIFLCRGDEIAIAHNGEQRLDGDPVPDTRAGVGYAWYECRPTADGPTLGAVAADACLLPNPTSTLPFIVSTGGRRDGAVTFRNDGAVQSTFAGGDATTVFFAPITFDSLDGTSAYYENGGSCVSVNVDAAFAVAYLNDVTTTGLTTSDCSGAFTVDGGLPELDAGARYTVEIVDLADASVRGTFLNPTAAAGDQIRFRVPRAGTYRITVTDGKGCRSAALTADLTGCTPPPAVAFAVDTVVAAPGATVCVPLRASGFAGVTSIDLTVDYDEVLLRLDNVNGVAIAVTDADDGDRVRLTAASGGSPYPTLADGGVLLELCFEVLGLDGEFGLAELVDVLEGATVTGGAGQAYTVTASGGGVAITDDDIAVLATQTLEGCAGADDSEIVIAARGGTPPYNVSYGIVGDPTTPTVLADDSDTRTLTDLAPGTYRIAVAEQSGARVGETFITVVDGPALGVRIERLADLRCAGDAIAALRAIPTLGGADVASPGPGYAYSWDNGAAEAIAAGLGAGGYQVTVTDPRGCSATAAEALADPTALSLVADVDDASCLGVDDGRIELQAAGGTPGSPAYTYVLTDPSGGETQRVGGTAEYFVEPGSYVGLAVDDNGCRATVDPIAVAGQRVLAVNTAVDSITCFGTADAQLEAVPFAATGTPNDDYNFTWFRDGALDNSTAVSTPRRSTNGPLIPGTYVLVATDADGCTARDTYALADPPRLEIALVDSGDETCVPGADGFAEAIATGGRTWGAPYAYRWTDSLGAEVSDEALAQNLTAGSYRAVVTDQSGCADTLAPPVAVRRPEPPRIVAFDDAALLCHGYSDAVLRVEAEPTTNPIDRIDWLEVRGAPGSGTIQRGLVEGAYVIEVVDVAGCVRRDTALVTAPDSLVIADAALVDPACFEQGDGSITLTMSGGTAPYIFDWNNGVSGQDANRIAGAEVTAGAYAVSVTDANFCPRVDTVFSLDDPEGINPTETDEVWASCATGVCDGGLTVSAELPGDPGATFSFAWESGEAATGVTELTASRLCGGRQVLSIQESSGRCPPQEFAYDIPSPDPLVPEVALERDARCFGERSGRIELDTTYGGTPGFTYAWNYGAGETAFGRQLGDLPAGEVGLLITDAAGCTLRDTFQIGEPAELLLHLDSALTRDPTCFGLDDGVVALRASGGNASLGGYAFRWNDDPNRTDPIARDVGAGRFIASATDAEGCIDTLVYLLAEPTPVDFALLPLDTLDCFGDDGRLVFDTIAGGQGATMDDYTVSVDGDGHAELLRSGYLVPGGQPVMVSVRDSAGCEAREEVTVPVPPQITVQLEEEIEVELGDSIRLRPSIFAGGAPILYDSLEWTERESLSFRLGNLADPYARPFEETTYRLTVRDAAGCSETAQIRVMVDRNRNVFIPNAFSPNNDAVNDEFEVLTGPGVARINYVRVFDRWGQLVYSDEAVEINDFGEKRGWDGNFRGERVPMGVYVYVAEVVFLDGREVVFRGDVNVVY